MRDMGWPGDVRSEGGAYRGRGHQSGGGGGGGGRRRASGPGCRGGGRAACTRCRAGSPITPAQPCIVSSPALLAPPRALPVLALCGPSASTLPYRAPAPAPSPHRREPSSAGQAVNHATPGTCTCKEGKARQSRARWRAGGLLAPARRARCDRWQHAAVWGAAASDCRSHPAT